MDLLDIAIVKQLAGGGGGSGTDNYNDLSNLPKINDTTLSGNKTAASLGLQNEINSDNKLSSDLIDDTGATNLFVTEEEKLEWSGKQDEITNANKLDADLVDDEESTNKFVTAQDKETWNAKQNAIDSTHKLSSDLVDDTNHTNKFVTSQEKETWSGKQDALTFDDSPTSGSNNPVKSGGIYTALGNKFDTSNIIQSSSGIPASPTDSTVMSAKNVAENYTPNSSLVEVVDNGAKNQLNIPDIETLKALNTEAGVEHGTWSGNSFTFDGVTFTINYADNTITTSGTSARDHERIVINKFTFKSNNDYMVSGCPTGGSTSGYSIAMLNYTNRDTGGGLEVEGDDVTRYLVIYAQNSGTDMSGLTFKPMICTKSQFGISPEYEPYALGNQVITPALIEQVDSGAKNKFDFANASSETYAATVTKTTTNLAVTGATSIYGNAHFTLGQSFGSGTHVLSFKASNVSKATGTRIMVQIYDNASASGTPVADVEVTANGNYTITFDSTNIVYYVFVYPSRDTVVAANAITISDVMLCTLADWNVSHKYVPYRPNWDLVSKLMPIHKSENLTTNVAYTLANIYAIVPPKSIARITGRLGFGNSAPKGIILSESNSSSDFDSNSKLLCTPVEASDNTLPSLHNYALCINTGNTSRNVYLWVKSSTDNKVNAVQLITEWLGDA